MLQKVLVVLVGLVMSLVGALAPSGLFAAPTLDNAVGTPGSVEQTLATVREADGAAFVRLSTLWVEVDGRRVTEDAWGTGHVDTLRFKVGVKDVEGLALAIGDKRVPLRPTDVLTIRDFQGDFAYRKVNTAAATIQLQGAVKTTTLHEGAPTGTLRTEGGVPAVASRPSAAAPGESARIAYVVLDTGREVDTVSLTQGGARIETQTELATPETPAGNVLVKWVKIDGSAVREHTWGDGTIDLIEFEPVYAASDGVKVLFDGKESPKAPGAHHLVRGFVGEYLVYQVPGGLLRLKLDGYAERYTTGAAGGVPRPDVAETPVAGFEIEPAAPTTSDLVRFHDRSTAAGVIVFWRWDFGDGVVSTLQDPTHRYQRPGVYRVALNVTNDDLQTMQTTRTLVVKNTPPVADFDLSPRVVTTDTLVSFTDRSLDVDGGIVNWTWDFGDDTSSHQRHPSHRFTRSGDVTVTLTVRDEMGGVHSLTRELVVRNAPPVVDFDYAPRAIRAGVPVHFTSEAFDLDGDVVSWSWDFDDDASTSEHATGASVFHAFRYSGTYDVRHTVTDNLGAPQTTVVALDVANTPPDPDFAWTPDAPMSRTEIRFTNLAEDPDGVIVLSSFDFGDGTNTTVVTPGGQVFAERIDQRNVNATISGDDVPRPGNVTHRYMGSGDYQVTLCVVDNRLDESCVTKTLSIANSVPQANFLWSPQPGFRHVPVGFQDVTLDPDRDLLVGWAWEFGDGATSSSPRTVSHQYATLGSYQVNLSVTDSAGMVGRAQKTIDIVNHPPDATISISTLDPTVGETFWVNATPQDPDQSPGGFNFTWLLSDQTVRHGPSLELAYDDPGNFGARLVVRDGEGGLSNAITTAWAVTLALPTADFLANDTVPDVGQEVKFTDLSTSLNGAITGWEWSFNDNTFSDEQNPTHTFTSRGEKDVTLVVTDERGQRSEPLTQRIVVNAPPVADFLVVTAPPYDMGDAVTFRDQSTDADPDQGDLLRTWDFGDGEPVSTTTRDVTHTFQLPGIHAVTLAVTDDNGAQTSVTKPISVRNAAPVASWSLVTQAPEAGSPLQLDGTASHDPDGTSLTAFNWSFGDGQVLAGTDPAPFHTYAQSGLYWVALQVSDGFLESPRLGDAVGWLRVGANHDLAVDVRAVLPDGVTTADLSQPHFEVQVATSAAQGEPVDYDKTSMTPTSTGGTFTIPHGTWARSDVLTVHLRDTRFMDRPITRSFTLTDADSQVSAVFDLELPLVPTLTALPGDAGGGLVSSNAYAEDGTPIYHSLTEAFHGVGHVAYLGGLPASGAEVTIEVRFLPGHLPVVGGPAARDRAPTLDTDLLGWCLGGAAFTNATGAFEWVVDADASCTLDAMSLHAPGRYEVRATAHRDGALLGATEPASLYVDPTGVLANVWLP